LNAPEIVVWTRDECPLCEELVAELALRLGARGLACTLRDVDADPVARRRYGLKVPVVEVDGQAACHGHLDWPRVAEALGRT
jgi:Glutaredoxin-like domain (DUF836)